MNNRESQELYGIIDKNLGILIRIVEAVHNSSDLKEIYNTALDLVVELEKVDMAAIYIVEEATGDAVMKANRGFPDDYVKNAGRIPSSKGITWKVINSGEILNIEDVHKYAEIGPAGRRAGYHGVLGVPVMLDQKAIGVIWFARYVEEKFTPREVELLSTIGSQIAIAISKAKQTQELEERNLNLSVLSAIAENVHKSVDLKLTYESFLEMTKSLDIYDIMALYLVDEKGDTDEAVLQIQSGLPEQYLKQASRVRRPHGVTWDVIQSGEPKYHENMRSEDTAIGPAGKALGPRSVLSIPLKSGARTIGVIHFTSLEKTAFDNKERDFLFSLGNQIGTAIAKAMVFEEARERAEELQSLYENLQSAQSQLIQSEKLASLGQLVSSIAHEINNPLTPILGYSQLLITQKDTDIEKREKFLDVINESAEKVKRIVENLLSFARTDKPNREYTDINTILDKAVEFREYQLSLENIEVVRRYDPQIPKTMVDANQLQQVFTNIILNADHAMADVNGGGGVIEITTRVRDGRTIEITISDNGPGMEKDLQEKIFDPFFTTKPPGVGTGLGLSVSYGIIKEHGGEITVSSETGEGTKFTMLLPVLDFTKYMEIQNAAPEVEKKGVAVSDNASLDKVLIVEDEEIVTTLIKGILEGDGYNVDLALNGEDALSKIDGSRYRFIVCDIKMPQMNGMEFFNKVKSLNDALASRILFITGDPSSDTLGFIQETGNKYLAKPFKIEDFKEAVTDMA